MAAAKKDCWLNPAINADPWAVSESGFPADGTALEKLLFLLNYAVLAPSSRNSQPWIWQIDGEGVRLYADHSRCLQVTDQNDREMFIACGAALRFLELAVHHFGYESKIEFFPEGSARYYVARVKLGPERAVEPSEEPLFYALKKRHTNRGLFDNKTLPEDLLRQLERDAHHYGVWLQVVTERERREQLVELITRGDLAQWADGPFRAEMAQWVRSDSQLAGDGMPVQAMGFNSAESKVLPVAMKVPLLARLLHLETVQADRSWVLAGGAPVLAVMGTQAHQDSSRDWVDAGQALASVLLRCCASGIAVSFFNSPVQVHHLWTQVFRILQYKGFIHLVFRLGYPLEPSVAAPRRPVSEVLYSADQPVAVPEIPDEWD